MKRITSYLLTKDRDSLILGRGNDIGQYQNITVINKLQAIPWEINEDILPFINDTLKPADEPLTAYEEQDRINSFKLRDSQTTDVIDYLLANGNKFWFGWKYDKRGRSYSQGYNINPQGNAYRKAMLSYSDKEMLTTKGIKYLKYDIANHLGYDKDTWFKRLIEANKVIKDVFADGRSRDRKIKEYALKADEPELFIKAILAYKKGVIEQQPIGHNMGLDATSSGYFSPVQ